MIEISAVMSSKFAGLPYDQQGFAGLPVVPAGGARDSAASAPSSEAPAMHCEVERALGLYEKEISDLRARVVESEAENDQWQKKLAEVWAENAQLRETIAEWQKIHGTFTGDVHAACQAEIERLRARLCYVNPDGSHVRGCAQHEAQHPAQWCESLARRNNCP